MEVEPLKTRPHTSSSRPAEVASSYPHRNSVDTQGHRLNHRRSVPSQSFPSGYGEQSSPLASYMSRGSPLSSSTYPPPISTTHHRENSIEFRLGNGSHHTPTIPPLRQYATSSYSSTDTRGSPASIILSPTISRPPLFASPIEMSIPRTEQIQLPPIRGIASMPSLPPAHGLGIRLDSERSSRDEPKMPSTKSPKRGPMAFQEIVEGFS